MLAPNGFWFLRMRERVTKAGDLLETAETHWWGLTSGLSIHGAPCALGALSLRHMCRLIHLCAQHTHAITQSPRPGHVYANLCPRQSQPRTSHVSSWGISVTWRWPVCCRTFIAGVYPLDDIALSAPGLWQSKMSAGTASAPSFGAEDHRFILTPHLLCTWSPSYDQPTSLMWGKFISRSYRSTNMLRFCFKNHSFERFPPKHILKSNEKVFIHTHLSQSIELVIFLLSPSSSSDFHVLLSTSFWGQRQPWEAYL